MNPTSSVHIKYIWMISLLGMLLGMVSYYFMSEFLYRFLRFLIPLSFLLLIFKQHGGRSHRFITAFLVLYTVSSIAAAWFEHPYWGSVSMLVNGLSFLLLSWGVVGRISWKNISWGVIGMVLIVLGINGTLTVEFLKMLQPMTYDQPQFVSICIMAAVLFILGLLIFVYNHQFNTKATLMFSGFGLVLIFAETFRGVGYYDLAFKQLSDVLGRLLTILSLAMLTHYTFIETNDDQPLSEFRLK